MFMLLQVVPVQLILLQLILWSVWACICLLLTSFSLVLVLSVIDFR
jgi:hypothetical protein